jgi:DNA repair exonuclease SbcCD nuclease subunit
VAELLKQYHTFQIIDEVTPVLNNKIILAPWGQIPTGYRGEYCMGHFEFTGFKMNNTYVCERGTALQEITPNGFKHIYSGHFHTPSAKDNVTYLGSPFQMTFADINSDRGYYIWEDGELEFIKFKYAPEFKVVETSNLDSAQIATNIVRLVFIEDYGSLKNQQIIDQVLGYNPVRLQVDFSRIKIEGTEDKMEENLDSTLLDHDGIIVEYINKTEVPPKIKKKTLLSMIEKLRRKNE